MTVCSGYLFSMPLMIFRIICYPTHKQIHNFIGHIVQMPGGGHIAMRSEGR